MWWAFLEVGIFLLIVAGIAWLVIPRKPKK
jgi:hypothetical protein